MSKPDFPGKPDLQAAYDKELASASGAYEEYLLSYSKYTEDEDVSLDGFIEYCDAYEDEDEDEDED